ncbi:hypothetical protein OROHE_006857 [Orobanche hederae]
MAELKVGRHLMNLSAHIFLEIVNLNKFVGHLTNDEQQQLLKLLPSTDTSEASDRNLYSIARLRRMFDSPQFKENLLSFQNYYKCSPMNILSLAEKLMKDAAARAKQVVNVGRGSMLILMTTQIDHQSYGLLVAIYCHLVDAHMRKMVLLICVTKVAKSAFDNALAEHEDIDDVVGSEEPTERDHGVDLQQPLLIKIYSSDSHKK